MHTNPATAPNGVLFAAGSNGTTLGSAYDPITEGWRWLHLAHASPEAQEFIAATTPEPVADALFAQHTRPRCEILPEGVLFIGRGVNLDPETTPDDMVSVRAWLDDTRLITVVMRRLRSAEAIAVTFTNTADTANRPTSPADVLARLLAEMVARMDATVHDVSDELDALQEQVIDDAQSNPTTAQLAPVRLRALTLHRYLVPLLDATERLAQTGRIAKSPDCLQDLADTRDRLRRLVEDLSAAESRAAIARDEIVSQASELLNRRVYALTVLAAGFLPLTVLTGALGMNVGGIPLADHTGGFLITSAILAVLIAGALGLLRLIRWI